MTTAIEDNDIEAELSYAFLHAVASQSQAICSVAPRLSDNRGIDAHLTSWGPFASGAPGFDSSRPKSRLYFNKIKHLAMVFCESCNGTFLNFLALFTLAMFLFIVVACLSKSPAPVPAATSS